jgi:hypothetical protein
MNQTVNGDPTSYLFAKLPTMRLPKNEFSKAGNVGRPLQPNSRSLWDGIRSLFMQAGAAQPPSQGHPKQPAETAYPGCHGRAQSLSQRADG